MIREYLNIIFLEHFLLTTSLISLMTLLFFIPYFTELVIFEPLLKMVKYFIVGVTTFILIFLLNDFFNQNQGLDKLASIPLLLAVLPLVISSMVTFFLPIKKYSPDGMLSALEYRDSSGVSVKSDD